MRSINSLNNSKVTNIMGFFSSATGQDAHYGNHGMTTGGVLNAVEDAVSPTTGIQWQTKGPAVVKDVKRATLQEADTAEKESSQFVEGVKNGLRVLKAETKKQLAQAKLVKGHRRYMRATSMAHLAITQANGGLANTLHGAREKYAELGFGLDRREETATAAVDRISEKYRGVVSNPQAEVRR